MTIRTHGLVCLIAAALALGAAPARARGGVSVTFGYGHNGAHGFHGKFHRRHDFHHYRHHGDRRHFHRHHAHRHRGFRWHYRRRHRPHHNHHGSFGYYGEPGWRPPYAYHPPPFTRYPAHPPQTVEGADATADTPAQGTRRQAPYCREFTGTVTVDGEPARAHGRACRQPDGSWRITRED